MKVIWAAFAVEMLEGVYNFHKERVSIRIARKIKNEILTAARQLKEHPVSGQLEVNLKELNQGHRYLVKGNYKIIYRIVPEGVLITDLFDTRQDPDKMKEEEGRKIR